VVLAAGFPEETLRPLREALGWGLSAALALAKDHEPGPDLPPPREVESELVDRGRLPEELAARLARVRELTELPEGRAEAPPPAAKALTALGTAVRDLIELGQRQVMAEQL
jgi:hypothetical protein